MTVDTLGLKNVGDQKVSWEAFVKQNVLNFLMEHNMQSITVDDGAGKKGVIKRTAKGDYSVQITSNEII